ncbi:MAG: hypothetical protein ACFFDB_00510 [Promethearchaeota archaeon]
MKNLRYFEQDFKNWGILDQEEMGVMSVPVKDIIGTNSAKYKDFYEDWKPVINGFDLRYDRVAKFVSELMKDPKRWYDEAIDLNYVHLFQFFCDKLNKNVFYVCNAGNRRISVAHALNIKEVLAQVTLLINKPLLQRIQNREFNCPKCNKIINAKITFIDWERNVYCSKCGMLTVVCYDPRIDKDLDLEILDYEEITDDHSKKIDLYLDKHQFELERIKKAKSLLPHIRKILKDRMETYEND